MSHCFTCNFQVIIKQLDATKMFVSCHVSDHSGFHCRQVLLQHLPLDEVGRHLETEMELVTDLIMRFSGHEALWYHRLVCHILKDVFNRVAIGVDYFYIAKQTLGMTLKMMCKPCCPCENFVAHVKCKTM